MKWSGTCRGAALVAVLVVGSGAARAATLWQLLNHPGPPPVAQTEGPFGLRIDDADGRQTFNFEEGGANVFFEITGADTATIHGTVEHNQSGQLWALTANLTTVVTTNKDDGGTEPWYDPTLPDSLYDGVLEDLILFGDTTFGDGGTNLKTLAFEADRIGFYLNDVTMLFQGPPGDADFDPDGNGDGFVELFGVPAGDPSMLPMVVAKGHNLDATTNQLAGIGWLEEENQQEIYLRDFIFTFGDPIPEPSALGLFATGFLICGAALRRRRM